MCRARLRNRYRWWGRVAGVRLISLLAALCYAEPASAVPAAGSSFLYGRTHARLATREGREVGR